MKIGLLAFALLSAGVAHSVQAQTPAPDTIPRSKLTLDLGYVNAAGNTDVSTLSAGEAFEYRGSRAELLQTGSVINGRSGDVTVADQLKTGARVNFLVVKPTGLFVGAAYERNRFAGIARRWEESAGLALRLVNMPTDTWMLELGAALNQQRNTLGMSRNFTSLRAATAVRHSFSKTSFLQQLLEFLPTLDDWNDHRINSETAVVAAVSGHVALKISYIVKFDNVPELRPLPIAPGSDPRFRKSDRIFSSGIQVVF